MKYDYVIVGAGIAGVNAAYWLSRVGSVLLLDMEHQAGYHTTSRSAAIYLPNYDAPLVQRLTRMSYDFLAAPPSDLGIERPLFEPRDILYIARSGQKAEFEEFVGQAQGSSYAPRTISKVEALERMPVLRAKFFEHAALQPGAFDMDVSALHQGFLRAARRRGAVIRLGSGLQHAVFGRGVWTVSSGEDEFQTTCIVNAAGAWADEVACRAGLAALGLTPLRRTIVTIPCEDPRYSSHWPMVENIGEWLYFKPESGGLLASCGDETPCAPCDVQPEDLDVAITVDRLEQATSLCVRRVTAQWAGLRTFAVDRLPVVGADPRVPGFYWLAGVGGYGIQTAPALGLLLARLASREGFSDAGESPSIDPCSIAVERLV